MGDSLSISGQKISLGSIRSAQISGYKTSIVVFALYFLMFIMVRSSELVKTATWFGVSPIFFWLFSPCPPRGANTLTLYFTSEAFYITAVAN